MKKKFGSEFLPVALCAQYAGGEWSPVEKKSLQNSPLTTAPNHPGLHYAISVFEGIRAMWTENGFHVFRLADHLERLNRSCSRLLMPAVNVQQLAEAIYAFLASVPPTGPNEYLYIRPIVFNNEPVLDMMSFDNYQLVVFFCPTRQYETDGGYLGVNDDYPRAWPGGTGDIKSGANYGHMLLSMQRARQNGCNQEIWLDTSKTFVEEIGTMNFFLKAYGTIYTPALNGSILPGITRHTVLQLCTRLRINAQEVKLPLSFVLRALQEDPDAEIFGTGTASGIVTFNGLKYQQRTYTLKDPLVSKTLKNQLFERYQSPVAQMA